MHKQSSCTAHVLTVLAEDLLARVKRSDLGTEELREMLKCCWPLMPSTVLF